MATRMISGFVLGFLFLLLVMQSTPWILLAFGIPHAIALFEFLSLKKDLSPLARYGWLAGGMLVWGAACYALLLLPTIAIVLAAVAFLAIGLPLEQISRFERSGEPGKTGTRAESVGFSFFFITLPFALMVAIAVSSTTFPFLLLLIGSSWAADTAGVFCGKYFGAAKLVPRLSPKKTREGAVGGVLAGGLVWVAATLIYGTDGLGGSLAQSSPPLALGLMFVSGALIAALGVCGDLVFSMRKRIASAKDYGSIIPGHGGVLDRFDAMIFASPLVFLGFLLSNWPLGIGA